MVFETARLRNVSHQNDDCPFRSGLFPPVSFLLLSSPLLVPCSRVFQRPPLFFTTILAMRFNGHRRRLLTYNGASPQLDIPVVTATPVVRRDETAVSGPSASLKTLVAIIAILSVIILAIIAIWKFRAWRRFKQRAATPLVVQSPTEKGSGMKHHIDLEVGSMSLEKPEKAVLWPPIPPADSNVGWVPQIRYVGGADVSVPKLSKSPSYRSLRGWKKSSSKRRGGDTPSPPPAYMVANGSVEDLPPLPVNPITTPLPSSRKLPSVPTPPTPPISIKIEDHSTPPTPSTPCTTVEFRIPFDDSTDRTSPLPVHSPARSFSFATEVTAPLKVSPRKGDKRLPRLMTVASTFTPTMDDELSVEIHETVRLLEEYQDEWCLVQRVGRDTPKGVIPRSCLQERVETTPTRQPFLSPHSVSKPGFGRG